MNSSVPRPDLVTDAPVVFSGEATVAVSVAVLVAEDGLTTKKTYSPPAVWMPEWYAHIRERRTQDPASEWNRVWEYGAFCDVRDVAAAAVLALTCPDPGHVTILLCADDIGSDTPSRQMAQKMLPDVPWVGGPEYESEPYRALVSNRRAKEVLGWQPKYAWERA